MLSYVDELMGLMPYTKEKKKEWADELDYTEKSRETI